MNTRLLANIFSKYRCPQKLHGMLQYNKRKVSHTLAHTHICTHIYACTYIDTNRHTHMHAIYKQRKVHTDTRTHSDIQVLSHTRKYIFRRIESDIQALIHLDAHTHDSVPKLLF